MLNLIKYILKSIGINKLVYLIQNTWFKFSHWLFLIIMSGKNFNLVFKGKKITVVKQNYFRYKNKPLWFRLFDRTYERQEIKSILKFLDKEMTVLELGGSIGVTSVIINSLLAENHKHVVCEANPNLIENLELNKINNKCNFVIENKPISSKETKVKFNFNDISLGGSILDKSLKYQENNHGAYKNILITTTTPKEIEEKFNLKFDCLICDIEGEEFNLLIDLIDYFKNFKLMIVEFHFDEKINYSKLENIKKNYDPFFNISHINNNNVVFLKKNN